MPNTKFQGSFFTSHGLFPRPGEEKRPFFLRARAALQSASDETHLQEYGEVLAAKKSFLARYGLFPSAAVLCDARPPLYPLILAQHVEEWEEGRLIKHWIELPLKRPLLSLIRSLYSIEELLHHEWIHALRAGLQESSYEEAIAYSSSQSPLRRFLGAFLGKSAALALVLALLVSQLFLATLVASLGLDRLLPWLEDRRVIDGLYLSNALIVGSLLWQSAHAARFCFFAHRLKKRGLFSLLFLLDGKDLDRFVATPTSKWDLFFSALPGLYGHRLDRLYKKQNAPKKVATM